METFQKPLSQQEESYYLRMLKGDDAKACDEAREILTTRNLRLVAHVVKKYQGSGEDMEDLISIGTIGLMKAITTYDESKGSRLATYAARCIDNELLMMFRSRKKSSRDVSLYDPIGTDKEGNEINLLDVMLTSQDDFATQFSLKEDIMRLRQALDGLPDREREILDMRYGLSGGDEMTQREIGKMLGISRSYVSRIEKKAIETLKGAFDTHM